jgi:ATP-binding cassette subfamily F protein 3
LKTLLEKIPPFAGEAVLGANLKIGYFAQAHEGLHAEWTLVEEIQGVVPKMLPAEVRDYLAKFLFTGDDVFKTVNLLSGGERGRLALACLALQGYNLLLLDEPTNHLDLPSQEILQSVMADFRGTILLVSHDRYLIDRLATQIWEVNPKDQILDSFKGTYSEFKAFKQQLNQPVLVEELKPAAQPQSEKIKSAMSKGERQKIEKGIQLLEEKIAWLENEIRCLEEDLASPPSDPGQVQTLAVNYARMQAELEAHLEKWSGLHEALNE